MSVIKYEDLNTVNAQFYPIYEEKLKELFINGRFILGEHVSGFEEAFAKYCGVKYCVGVGNGLDALTMALKLYNFPPFSEVLVASNTYIATIIAILNNGLTPIFIEPDIESYNLTPYAIQNAITKKTKAVLITHLYGRSCDTRAIYNICKMKDIPLIEDCAQAHGATYEGMNVGSLGLGCYSFYPTKNLGAIGDGGCITTNNEDDYNKLKAMRNYGSAIKYVNDFEGVNSRLDEIQALFLRIKLQNLDNINTWKQILAGLYDVGITNSLIIKPIYDDYSVFHIYPIRCKERNRLKQYLLDNGIMTEIHYPIAPSNQKVILDNVGPQYTPIAEEIAETILSLPISFATSIFDVKKVIEVINGFK